MSWVPCRSAGATPCTGTANSPTYSRMLSVTGASVEGSLCVPHRASPALCTVTATGSLHLLPGLAGSLGHLSLTSGMCVTGPSGWVLSPTPWLPCPLCPPTVHTVGLQVVGPLLSSGCMHAVLCPQGRVHTHLYLVLAGALGSRWQRPRLGQFKHGAAWGTGRS